MTEFERNARYSYDEKLEYLRKSHDSQHLQTMSYKGYDVIMLSGLGKGLRFFFYKDGQLIKMRDKLWKDDIRLYARTYIDQVLNARKEECEHSMKCYQIWMSVWVEDEDGFSSSGHYENMPYSNIIYMSEVDANKAMNSIDKRFAYGAVGLSSSCCEKLYLKELVLKAPEEMHS